MKKIAINNDITIERIRKIIDLNNVTRHPMEINEKGFLKVRKGPLNLFISIVDNECVVRAGYVGYMILIVIIIALIPMPIAIISEQYLLIAFGPLLAFFVQFLIVPEAEGKMINLLKRAFKILEESGKSKG